jgi:hypothetical protein
MYQVCGTHKAEKHTKIDKSPLDTGEGEQGQKKTQVVEREDKSPKREKDKYRERTSRGKERRSRTPPRQLKVALTMIFHPQRHSLYSEQALMSVKQELWQESVEFFIVLAFEWHLSRHKTRVTTPHLPCCPMATGGVRLERHKPCRPKLVVSFHV